MVWMLQMCFEVWQPLNLRILLRVSTYILLVRCIESSLLNGSQNTSYLFSYFHFDKSGTIVRRAGLSTCYAFNKSMGQLWKLSIISHFWPKLGTRNATPTIFISTKNIGKKQILVTEIESFWLTESFQDLDIAGSCLCVAFITVSWSVCESTHFACIYYFHMFRLDVGFD